MPLRCRSCGLNFGLLIGLALRADHVHPLCRFHDRPGAGGRRRGGAVLAGLDARSSTVLAIFLVGQFLEGYVLAPKLVGESVGPASGAG